MLEQYEAARVDFDRYEDEFPNGPLAVNARLWRALTFFFQKNYEEALRAFDDLIAVSDTHPLFPEILYRRTTTLYAMRDFDRARKEMESFVRVYSAHPRHPEALVLLGDILMGAGELTAAKLTFETVPHEASA
jgi:TolA-binding protein